MNWRLAAKIFVAGGVLVFFFFGILLLWVIQRERGYKNLVDSHDMKNRVDKMARDYLARRSGAGLVIGLIQGGNTHVAGFGTAGGTNGAPPDGETVYEIGSVTKVYTAVALAEMVQSGAVRLDDPIKRFLPPEVACPQMSGQDIALKHLATHTAGLPRLPDNLQETIKDERNPYVNYHAADLYRGLSAVRLTKEPGSKSAYSNFGFGVLGHLLSLKAGKPYGTLIEEMICVPLGMTDTVIQLSSAQQGRLIPGHSPKGQVVPGWDFDALAGCGAIRSTANDQLKFLRANLGPLNSALGKAMALAQQVHYRAFIGSMGLGWQIREPAPNKMLHWHNGGTGGYVSFIGFDRASQVAVVILSNYGDAFARDDSVDKMGMEILKVAPKVSWE